MQVRRKFGLFAGILLFFTSSCSSMMFFPTKALYYDPKNFGLEIEEIRVPSYDGTSLYGWYFHHSAHAKNPRSKPKAVLFFAHGNGANVSGQFPALAWIAAQGYDFYIFDYRGYGVSEGDSPSPKEAVGDTIAALRWIDARAKREGIPLVAFGQSLGSALLVRAISEERKRATPVPERPTISFIALDSTFLSFEWATASVFSQHWITTPFQPLAFLLVSDEWAPRERIRDLAPTPLLILHGEEDRIIDVRLGQEAFDAALPPKELVRIPKSGHVQAFWGEDQAKYRAIFLDRMEKALRSSKGS
jgi:fermentation-respiration switch protein FrsA (DUF1100 family)